MPPFKIEPGFSLLALAPAEGWHTFPDQGAVVAALSDQLSSWERRALTGATLWVDPLDEASAVMLRVAPSGTISDLTVSVTAAEGNSRTVLSVLRFLRNEIGLVSSLLRQSRT